MKKTTRRMFSFYFYAVPTYFARGRVRRRFIPDLPSALRGSFWVESPTLAGSAIADLWQNETAHELTRTASARIRGSFQLSRIHNSQSNRSWPSEALATPTKTLLSRLTRRHFRRTFYSESPKSASQSKSALRSASKSKPTRRVRATSHVSRGRLVAGLVSSSDNMN
jgi:hypothetical protein